MTGRIDVVTIFPEFFAALDVSLIGKARAAGTLAVGVHDLRGWTTDRHRTVDDTPAGGGAGMVMRPDVWGQALDDVLADEAATLIIPTPGGEPFTQALARDLAETIGGGGQMVIACGRYEGIDARVSAHYGQRVRVREVSIGDYVLNGGEVAAMVMVEAVARLIPGVVGNPDSLVEESHGPEGLLEYPVYTAPREWRGLAIPDVLSSGDHRRIAAWRRAQALRRTAEVRPDLLAGREVTVRRGRAGDAQDLHDVAARTFPLACPPSVSAQEAHAFVIEHLSAAQFRTWARARGTILLVAELAEVVVGYTLVHLAGERADLNKFYVLPEHHGGGVSGALMTATLTHAAKAGARSIWLGVNQLNERAQRFYRRHGFDITGVRTFTVGADEHDDYVMERTLDFVS